MEEILFDWDISIRTGEDGMSLYTDFIDDFVAPKLGIYNNITYLGMASSGPYREAVFQIKNYTNLYLRLAKDDRTDWRFNNFPMIRLSTTADLSTCASYFTTNIGYGGSPHMVVSPYTFGDYDYILFRCKMWAVSDADNNLKCLWQFKDTEDAITYSQGIIIGEDVDNRDVIGVFSSGTNPIHILYFDDPNLQSFYIPVDDTAYQNLGTVLKENMMPICTANNRQSIVSNLKDDFVRIFNSDLGANENTNNKDSAAIRKLIQIGTRKYRQIVSNYWVEDPKGVETPETIPNYGA